MRLIGKRSVASVVRWMLGFVNVFVTIGVAVTGLLLLTSLVMPDFAAGLFDGLADRPDNRGRDLFLGEHVTLFAVFLATASTWWILNRLRRIFLSVNHGDAFEPANVGRLQAMGLGLVGVQVSAMILIFSTPQDVVDTRFELDLGAWLGILIVFMLAEVFRQGSSMRDDQQMTV